MKRVKILVSIFAILLCITLFFAWYIKGGFVPWSVGEYGYMSASIAQDDLIEAGFTNIELIPRDVEFLDEGAWAKPVTEITIDGKNDFREGDWHRANVPIKIYHNQVIRKGAPIDSNNIQNYAPEVLVQMFLDAGFTNVNLTKHGDLDMDFMYELDDLEYHRYYQTFIRKLPSYFNEVAIGTITQFDLGEALPISVPVQIDTHHQPNIHVVFVSITYQEPSKTVTEPIRIYKNGRLMPYWIFEYGEEISLVTWADYEDDQNTGTLALTFWREGSDWKSEELVYTVTEDAKINITLDHKMHILQEDISAAEPNRVSMLKDMVLRDHKAYLANNLEVNNETS